MRESADARARDHALSREQEESGGEVEGSKGGLASAWAKCEGTRLGNKEVLSTNIGKLTGQSFSYFT